MGDVVQRWDGKQSQVMCRDCLPIIQSTKVEEKVIN